MVEARDKCRLSTEGRVMIQTFRREDTSLAPNGRSREVDRKRHSDSVQTRSERALDEEVVLFGNTERSFARYQT